MKNVKVVMVITLGLFLVSLCVPEVYAQAAQRGQRPMQQMQPGVVADRLDLSDEQIDQLKKLREQQREIQKQFMEKAQALRKELGNVVKDAEANADQIEKMRDELFNIRIEQMKTSHMFQKEIRKVYTPEQLKILAAMKTRINRGRSTAYRRFPRRSPNISRTMNRGRGGLLGPLRMPRRGTVRSGWFWRFRRR